MDNNIRFRTSAMGFNKNDVYEHIESLYRTFDAQLKQKDEEIEQTTRHNNLLRQQIEELQDKFAGIEDYKSNIADVLVKAKEQGAELLKEAQVEAEERKKEIDKYIEKEKQKLESFKNDLLELKQNTVKILEKYQKEIDGVVEEIEGEEENTDK